MKGVDMTSRLRDLRKAAGLTQQELADRANVSRVTVSRWEGAKFSPSDDSAAKVAEALGISVDSLIEPENEPTRAGDHVASERDISAWRDLVIRDQDLTQWQQVILMSLPIFMDRVHWFAPVTVDQFIEETGRSRDLVEGNWDSVVRGRYVEAIGKVEWALRLIFP